MRLECQGSRHTPLTLIVAKDLVQPMKPSMKRNLENRVDESLSTLEALVASFCSGEIVLYSPILTELRKLLADENAVRSFDKNSNYKCLYAMRFTGVKRPFLNGFRKSNNVACPCLPMDGKNVLSLQDLIYHGAKRDSLIPLHKWLSTTSVYLGQKLNKVELRNAIKALAGKEGSHIINQDMKSMSFAITPNIETADFTLSWKCLIVDIAIRLLCAVRANKKTPIRPHELEVRAPPQENSIYFIQYNPQGW